MSQSNCTYLEVFRDGTSKITRAAPCFAPCKFDDKLKELRYLPEVTGGLTRAHVDFWIAFVKVMFPNDLPFKADVIDKGGFIDVLWTMTGFHKVRQHNLLYTTAFRYPDEFPEVVRIMYEAKQGGADDEALFRLFHALHVEMVIGGWRLKSKDAPERQQYPSVREYRKNMNHALIDPLVDSDWEPISLATFHANLKHDIPGVQLHFNDFGLLPKAALPAAPAQ